MTLPVSSAGLSMLLARPTATRLPTRTLDEYSLFYLHTRVTHDIEREPVAITLSYRWAQFSHTSLFRYYLVLLFSRFCFASGLGAYCINSVTGIWVAIQNDIPRFICLTYILGTQAGVQRRC